MSTKALESNMISDLLLERRIDLKKVLSVVKARWYIPVIYSIIAITIAYIQLRYTKSIYSAELTIKFDDEKGGQVGDLFKYGRVSGRIENMLKTEAEVIQSRSMAYKTLSHMNMYFNTYIIGDIVSSRLYPNDYFEIERIHMDSSDMRRSVLFQFNKDGTYELLKENNQKTGIILSASDTLEIGNSLVKIKANPKKIRAIPGQPITIVINNLLYEAIKYSSGIEVELEKNTNVMRLSFRADIPELARDYLNALAQVYIQETINNKAQAAEQTIRYIDDQLLDLSKKVSSAQNDLADFKSENKGIEPVDMSKIQFGRLVSLETQKNIYALRLKQLDNLQSNILQTKNKPVELLVFDAEDASSLSEMLIILNNLILDRISYSAKQKINSPLMVENEKKITEIKSAISKAIASIKQNLQNKSNDNDVQIAEILNQLKGLPTKEQALVNLERNFKINEKIYGYLQERRLENLITMSSIIPNASVIDEAILNGTPIYPKKAKNYLLALLIGIVAGIAFIFFSRHIYNKIPDKETIETLSRVPVIGVIKKLEETVEDDYRIHILKSPKSIFAESIRGIRTNINFILKGGQNKVICVTSSVSGEGKTFCTINLASSLTLLGNKVLIVGCDLRRPKIHLSFKNIDNSIGLTTYLIGKHNLDEVIKKSEYDNLYVLPAGPVPPNPAELIQSDKFAEFLSQVKNEYDYIFFDTAPVGLVSDSFPILAFADINLYILRAQYSKRDFAVIPDRLTADNKIKNMYTILNSFDTSAVAYSSVYRTEYGGYYGGGGYYYYGGYYGSGSYNYYGRKYYNNYYSGYYSDDELNPKSKFSKFLSKLFKRFKSKQ